MSRKGFTLIELVMVIVIIGILAAVAIPKFINLQQEAKHAVCLSNAGAIRTAISNFYAQCNLNATSINGSIAYDTATCFPNTTELATLTSAFAQNYFSEQSLPPVPDAVATWSAAYDAATGVINTSQCCP
ncbi:MAG: prepilin-type N-terminal cleavage/methylation domain-containing protein [Candidatus Omnitrophica bacterium]|nr:prepilin-type N-terminal cleavage/methylation domain-containing protein [Candidatus Omnitrophota bacterium]